MKLTASLKKEIESDIECCNVHTDKEGSMSKLMAVEL